MIKEDYPFKTKTNDLVVFWETPKENYKHDHLLVIIAQEQNKWKLVSLKPQGLRLPSQIHISWVF